jgi:hypothetical protein
MAGDQVNIDDAIACRALVVRASRLVSSQARLVGSPWPGRAARP